MTQARDPLAKLRLNSELPAHAGPLRLYDPELAAAITQSGQDALARLNYPVYPYGPNGPAEPAFADPVSSPIGRHQKEDNQK